MPIKFHCSQCNSQLKVSEEHAGKSAKCPSCQTINQIPMATPAPPTNDGGFGEGDFGDGGLPTDTTGVADNPFAEQMHGSSAMGNPYTSPKPSKAPSQALSGGSVSPTPVEFDQIWTPAFQCWKANLGLMVGCMATMIGVNILFSLLGYGGGFAAAQTGSDVAIIAVALVVNLASIIVQLLVNIGFARICLKLLRRQRTSYGDLFSGAEKIFPVFVAGVIFSILFFVGFLALVVPGIFVALLLWSYFYLIVDEKAGILDSLSTAMKIGSVNKLTSFVMFMAAMGLGILGAITCYIGLLFTGGLVYMLYTSAYLKMSGQLR